MSDPPKPGAYGYDDVSERTAVVTLSSLRTATRKEAKDRHLLIRARGAQLGQVMRLAAEPVRIGRSQECELWLSDDGVSRKHARIDPDPEGYVVQDTESANGTFVAGQRVDTAVLRDGDLIQFGPQAVFRYSIADESQEQLLRQLYEASVTDALTGANNREHFDAQLRMELSYARRHSTDLVLLLLDVDYFKRVNDTYGHPVGDDVLIEIARAVRKLIRNEDVFARYGGEEFALILRGIDINGGRSAGERVREHVEKLTIAADRGPIKVTVSVGCASLGTTPDATTDTLIQTADRRLYAAKHAGRNQVVAND